MSITESSLARQLRAIAIEHVESSDDAWDVLAGVLGMSEASVSRMLSAPTWDLPLAIEVVDALDIMVRVAH